MNNQRMLWCKAAMLSAGIVTASAVSAGQETLECTLYITQSMDSAVTHSISIEPTGESLGTLRRAGYCIFANGEVADKQFVMVNRALDGGKRGSNQGFSTYTMSSGDTISTEFSGTWNNGPYEGTYRILGGTGAYADASGDGTIAGTDSPWKTTSVVKIVLNVKTP